MPSKKAYDLVSDDGYDSRIPLHNEEAFQHGLQFQTKYIGSVDVPRPNTRAEIVAAMRKTRYEFKAKAIKKKTIILTVSVEGVKVMLRKKKKYDASLEESKLVIMQHPIYRIFYVSHDSQDLKIWSYIVRDGPNNMFKCNVFKAYKKSHAMHIVRTIGQAFEVCHKLGDQCQPSSTVKENASDKFSEDIERKVSKYKEKNKELNNRSTKCTETCKQIQKPSPPNELSLKNSEDVLHGSMSNLSPLQNSPATSSGTADCNSSNKDDNTRLSLGQHHHLHLLRQQLEQQQQQTQVALAQVHLLKDQLSAETSARIEAQARAHQLLLYNKDLLDHVTLLVSRVRQLEMKLTGSSPRTPDQYRASSMISGVQCTSPTRPASFGRSDSKPLSHFLDNDTFGGTSMLAGLDADSPDSGHREMSSDSLSYSLTDADASSYLRPHSSDHNKNSSDCVSGTTRPSRLDLSSSSSKSRTLKSAKNFTSVDHQGKVSSVPNISYSSAFTSDSYICKSPDSHNESSQSSPYKKEISDKRKLISPLVSPSSSETQRLEYHLSTSLNDPHQFSSASYSLTSTPLSSVPSSVGRTTPKIDPPPKYGRTSRQVQRWERGSWCGLPFTDRSEGLASESDYMTRSNHGVVAMRPHSVNSSNFTTAGTCYFSDNRDKGARVASQRQKIELRVNDLSSSTSIQQQKSQYHHQLEHGKWKMSLSYTSDENCDYDFQNPSQI